MDTLLSAEPSSYWQLIRRSMTLYNRSFSRVIILSFLMAVIVFIPRFLSIVIGQDLFLGLEPWSLHRFWLVVIELASLIFFIGIIWRMHCFMIGKRERLIEDFNIAFHKLIAVVIASILSTLIVLAVCAAIIGLQILLHEANVLFSSHIIGIIVTVIVFFGSLLAILYTMTLFIFLIPLIAIENCNAFQALEKSVLLGWNHWWRIFAVQCSPWIVYFIVTIFLRFVLKVDLHVYFIDHSPHNLTPSIIHMILFAFFIPWDAAVLLVQIKDLETRNRLMQTTAAPARSRKKIRIPLPRRKKRKK